MMNPPPPPKPPTPHKAEIAKFVIDNPAFEDDNQEDDFQFTVYEELKVKLSFLTITNIYLSFLSILNLFNNADQS